MQLASPRARCGTAIVGDQQFDRGIPNRPGRLIFIGMREQPATEKPGSRGTPQRCDPDSQSCNLAHPPTYSVGPMLRAGVAVVHR
jgi:hypothetical protein